MRELLDGGRLVLRSASAADAGAVARFCGDVLRHQDAPEPDQHTEVWARELMAGRHPEVRPDDFTLVEEAATGAIVSVAGLISQTWMYEDVPFGVGQPELIGTRADRRGRGLVRRQLDVLHRRAAARGHAVTAIDGVPWFYRQFGYEMALELRAEISVPGARVAPAPGSRNARLRAATVGDLGFIAGVYDAASRRHLVWARRDDAAWRYELARAPAHFYRTELRMIETTGGAPIGFLAHGPRPIGGTLGVVACEVAPTEPWAAWAPGILACLRETARTHAVSGSAAGGERLGLCLGSTHPLYEAVRDLAPRDEGAYAWYLRVPDLPGFVRRIAPVLERRLAGSAWRDHQGTLRIGFYRDGLALTLDRARVVAVSTWQPPMALGGVERWQPTRAERPLAAFPGLTFLQLLFGFRSLDELRHAFPDCLVRSSEVASLLTTLFPKRPSNVWATL